VHLFDPLQLRGVTIRNRIAVSPMCEYSSEDGFANNWHLVHLGSRAVGGAGVVFTEATAVTADGRISPQDLGIYHDSHVAKLAEIARFVREQGAVPGIQLAHAGRKASTARPWDGGAPLTPQQGGWRPIWAPSPLPFADGYQVPQELTTPQIAETIRAFARAAERAVEADFRIIELHGAHGYLIHSFLSPLSNARTDAYGGSFENRCRFLREVVAAVRAVMPATMPLFVRISASDWARPGWDIDDSVALAQLLRSEGVDLIDCSSGGSVPVASIPAAPGYQVPFAARIRRDAAIPTGAIGLITEPRQADAIITSGDADIVSLARAELRDPYWPLHAAVELGVDVEWPPQYLRAKPRSGPVGAGIRS
jgi:2,4-dienoyl-CoA reductase-like NADH-dependent reductase (Old Yellow Enzyme family)